MNIFNHTQDFRPAGRNKIFLCGAYTISATSGLVSVLGRLYVSTLMDGSKTNEAAHSCLSPKDDAMCMVGSASEGLDTVKPRPITMRSISICGDKHWHKSTASDLVAYARGGHRHSR